MKNLTRWSHPANYVGTRFPAYFLGLSQHRDSDTLERCNFAVLLDRLGGESDTVIVARASHWAVGWCETILVHESDADRLRILSEAREQLADYPVLDEGAFSDMESEEQDETFDFHKSEFCREVLLAAGVPDPTEQQVNDAEPIASAVYSEDCMYQGIPDAWVTDRSIARWLAGESKHFDDKSNPVYQALTRKQSA